LIVRPWKLIIIIIRVALCVFVPNLHISIKNDKTQNALTKLVIYVISFIKMDILLKFQLIWWKKCGIIGSADILPPCWMTGRIIRYNFESRHPKDDPIFDWNWSSGFTFREADLWNCLLQMDAKWWQQLTIRVKWTNFFYIRINGIQ